MVMNEREAASREITNAKEVSVVYKYDVIFIQYILNYRII
jgi:hypothetical protein